MLLKMGFEDSKSLSIDRFRISHDGNWDISAIALEGIHQEMDFFYTIRKYRNVKGLNSSCVVICSACFVECILLRLFR